MGEKYGTFNIQRKIKEITGITLKGLFIPLKDKNRKINTDKQEKLKIWAQYIQQPFADGENQIQDQKITNEDEKPEITMKGAKYALRDPKNNKSQANTSFQLNC